MEVWNCPVCGFEAKNDEKKKEHMQKMTDDAHRQALKEKTKNEASDMKEKVEDTWEDIKNKVQKMT